MKLHRPWAKRDHEHPQYVERMDEILRYWVPVGTVPCPTGWEHWAEIAMEHQRGETI